MFVGIVFSLFVLLTHSLICFSGTDICDNMKETESKVGDCHYTEYDFEGGTDS